MKLVNVFMSVILLAVFLFTMEASAARNIPLEDDLLFGVLTETFPDSGETGPWECFMPEGEFLQPIATPTVANVNGAKWDHNVYIDADGYRFGNEYVDPIAVDGVSIVTVVKPERDVGTSWSSVVDIFYNELCLLVRNSDGLVGAWRDGTITWAPAGTEIPEQQVTILSLVIQTNGSYKVWANGSNIMDVAAGGSFTALTPGEQPFMHYINVGRNNPDGWSTFSGYIGDVFVYKVALDDADRIQLEEDIAGVFKSSPVVMTAPATDITLNSATLNGVLQSEGTEGPVEIQACYGTNDYGSDIGEWPNVELVGRTIPTGAFSHAVTGLTPGLYYYNFYAENPISGTFADKAETFGIAGLPQLNAQAPYSVRVTTARAQATLVTNFAPTTVKLYHGSADGGTVVSNWAEVMDLGIQKAGRLDKVLDGLTGTHYFRYYAENSAGGVWASATSVITPGSPFNTEGYANILEINFTGYAGMEQLLDYPVLIELNESIPDFHYSDFLSMNSPAADIRFMAQDRSELVYEIDTWDTGSSSYLWVQVPVLESNTFINMYYGKAGDSAPVYTENGSTWSEDFIAVWHMTNNLCPNATGVTNYNINGGDSLENITNGVGPIGVCRDFTPYSRLQAGDVDLPIGSFTLSFWASLDDRQGDRWNIQKLDSYSFMDRYGWWEFNINNWIYKGWGAWAAFESENTNWVYVSGTYDGANLRIYKNGMLEQTKPQIGMTQSDAQMYIGQNVNGKLDEVRAHGVARSVDWLQADYDSQVAPLTFGTYAVVPEPVCIGLLAIAGMLALRRRD